MYIMHKNVHVYTNTYFKYICTFLFMYVFNNQIHSLFHYNLFILAASIPLRIREARVPIVHDNECVRKINSVTEKIFILPTSSFCAGGEKGHDACQVKMF